MVYGSVKCQPVEKGQEILEAYIRNDFLKMKTKNNKANSLIFQIFVDNEKLLQNVE